MSCFETISEKIICFYLNKDGGKLYFNLHKFEKDFTSPVILEFETNYYVDKLFYKCIHLKDNIGIFAYYKKESNDIYPYFLFKDFQGSGFVL